MIDEEVTATINEFARAAVNDRELQQLSNFYDEMKRSGIAQNQGYALPPIDTIGATAYRNRSSRNPLQQAAI